MPVQIHLKKAADVPKLDLFSQSDPFCTIEALAKDGTVLGSAVSKVIDNCKDPCWDSKHSLPDPKNVNKTDAEPSTWDIKTTSIRITIYDKDTISNEKVGSVEVLVSDLLEEPDQKLLVHDNGGNPVLSRVTPPWPCWLEFSLETSSIPDAWEVSKRQGASGPFKKHIFLMSRGTRGDVQPFVCLARGMAELHNCLVTVCTEYRWKSFVMSNANVSKGKVQFRDSGGDTEKRVNTAVGQWATNQTTEVMQMVMLASSEAEFFNSATVIMQHLRNFNDGTEQCQPVDLLVAGMTLTNIAIMAADYYHLPFSLFYLQPSSIPSADREWTAVQAIDTHGGLGIRDSIEAKLFTGQTTLTVMKSFLEKGPLAEFNIRAIRGWFGLPPVKEWDTMRDRNTPIVIPMQPGTFNRPSDWWSGVACTDFIFLRHSHGVAASIPESINGFIQLAKADGAKLCLMTFSSMPVPRASMLKCAVAMVSECKFNLRVIYVGKRMTDKIPNGLAARVAELEWRDRLLEVERADFGVIFPFMDAFVVHGGLGTTVEALRMKKPTTVSGPLLLDQRFWGNVCYQKGVGLPATHIDCFDEVCIDFANSALDPDDPNGWQRNAKNSDWGDSLEDGVAINVNCFLSLITEVDADKRGVKIAREDADEKEVLTEVDAVKRGVKKAQEDADEKEA